VPYRVLMLNGGVLCVVPSLEVAVGLVLPSGRAGVSTISCLLVRWHHGSMGKGFAIRSRLV